MVLRRRAPPPHLPTRTKNDLICGQFVTSGLIGDQFHRDHRGPGDHAVICERITALVADAIAPRIGGDSAMARVDMLPRVGAVRSGSSVR